MTSMWNAPLHRRWRGQRLRDPRQAMFLTLASLKWVLANCAYTPWYLVRYWRLLKFKLANPHIITRGMVFIGKGVEIHATPELAQLEIGRWVHIGDKNTIRAHEGSLRFGDKVVLGRGYVLGAHAVVKGNVPDYSIAVGAPARVVKNRQLAWQTSAAERAELAAA